MPIWVSWISALWPVAVTITPLIMIAGFLWLKTQFAGQKSHDALSGDVESIQIDIIKLQGSVDHLTRDIESAPTRLELMRQLSSMTERMSRMEAASEAQQRQIADQYAGLTRHLATNNSYLHTLIEKGLGQ